MRGVNLRTCDMIQVVTAACVPHGVEMFDCSELVLDAFPLCLFEGCVAVLFHELPGPFNLASLCSQHLVIAAVTVA